MCPRMLVSSGHPVPDKRYLVPPGNHAVVVIIRMVVFERFGVVFFFFLSHSEHVKYRIGNRRTERVRSELQGWLQGEEERERVRDQ